MDIAVAQQFLREHENTALATWRRDGRLQMSPVTVGLDGTGRAIISSNETTYKVRNLRRDPRAALCVFVEAFRGPWAQIEGTAEIVTLPDKPCHNILSVNGYFRRLKKVKETDSASPPPLRRPPGGARRPRWPSPVAHTSRSCATGNSQSINFIPIKLSVTRV